MRFIEFPSTWIFSGPTRSGKTVLLTKILKQFFREFSNIYWFNSEASAIPDDFDNEFKIISFNHLPDSFNDIPDGSAIIIDDFMLDCGAKSVCELFIRGSHHRK